MSSTRRIAVSYSRFSDPKQADGDSTDRQEREYRAFCQRHNLTPGKEVFADRGRSGYHGEHRTRGRLGQLLEAAKEGRFDPGTVVVIEAWDRLGRLRPDRQTELISELLRTGVNIGVCRLDDVFTEEDFGTHKWTTLAVFIQLAHQESKQKAERVAASWAQRRVRAREKGELLRSSLPAWIEVVNGKPRLIPERAAAVRRIYSLAADGLGHTRIVKTLQAEGVPALGKRIVRAGRTRSQFSGNWTKPYVALLLRDRRVVGEMQPMQDGKPAGPPLAGYYPAVVSEDEFTLARAGQEERLNTDSKGRRNGHRQGRYANVFKGLLRHARDDEGFVLHNKGMATNPELLIINARGIGGRSRSYTFPYLIFETAVLKLLKEVDPETILQREPHSKSRADVLRAKLANLRQDLARIQADIKAKYSRALVEVLHQIEAEEEQTANELQDELMKTAKPLEKAWAEVPTLADLIQNADDPDLARLKIRPALRAIIESMLVLIVPQGAWRTAAVQIFFVGGGTRHYLIANRTAGFHRKTITPEPLSFADMGVPTIDLRNPKDAEKTVKFLEKIDLNRALSEVQ